MHGASTKPGALVAAVAIAGLWSIAANALEMSSAYVLPMAQNQNLNLDAESAAVADANGDGRMDVAFFASGWGSSDASLDRMAYVYEQQADGTMALATQFTLAPGGVPRYYARGGSMADLDGDGKAELLFKGVAPNEETLAILSRNATGTYVEATRIPCPLQVKQIRIKDFDRDGHPDILVQSHGHGLSIHWGRGALAFSKPMYVLGYAARDVLFADVDEDGIDDLLSSALPRDAGTDTDNGAAAVGVNYGLPDGTLPAGGVHDFAIPSFIDVPGIGGSVALGQFPGTAGKGLAVWYEEKEDPNAEHPDYVLFHQNIAILSRTDRQRFAVTRQFRYQSGIAVFWPGVSRPPPALQATDFDDDGDDDLVVFVPKRIEILLQQGDGFAPAYSVPDSSMADGNEHSLITATNIADFNGDGCKDVGYLNRSYVINYRVDCPTATSAAAGRRATGTSHRMTPAARKPKIAPVAKPMRSRAR